MTDNQALSVEKGSHKYFSILCVTQPEQEYSITYQSILI